MKEKENEIVPGESPHFEVKEIGMDGYRIFFTNLEVCEDFVRKFWSDYSPYTARNIASGMLKPSHTITFGMRTMPLTIIDKEMEAKGYHAGIYIYGNGNPLNEKARAWLRSHGYIS